MRCDLNNLTIRLPLLRGDVHPSILRITGCSRAGWYTTTSPSDPKTSAVQAVSIVSGALCGLGGWVLIGVRWDGGGRGALGIGLDITIII